MKKKNIGKFSDGAKDWKKEYERRISMNQKDTFRSDYLEDHYGGYDEPIK